jgi:ubiquitin carboxyl-terminal hydrolase 7
VYIRGLPWKILASPRDIKGLGFFLQCNGEAKDLSWNCHGMATLKLKSHKEGQDDMEKKISHQFHSKANDWGFPCFIALDVSPSSFIIIASFIIQSLAHSLAYLI